MPGGSITYHVQIQEHGHDGALAVDLARLYPIVRLEHVEAKLLVRGQARAGFSVAKSRKSIRAEIAFQRFAADPACHAGHHPPAKSINAVHRCATAGGERKPGRGAWWVVLVIILGMPTSWAAPRTRAFPFSISARTFFNIALMTMRLSSKSSTTSTVGRPAQGVFFSIPGFRRQGQTALTRKTDATADLAMIWWW